MRRDMSWAEPHDGRTMVGHLGLRSGYVALVFVLAMTGAQGPGARGGPPTSMGPPSSVLSRVISVTASPVTKRAFQSTSLVVEENTTFGMSRQRRGAPGAAGGGGRRRGA